MEFVFDIQKAIAATAYLCQQNGGKIDILPLIKMLYLADRKALVQWHRTITGDRMVSMRHGPILSRVYDLLNGRVMGEEMRLWNAVFNAREGNAVSLKQAPKSELDELSEREMDALKEAYREIQAIIARGVRISDRLHEILPEWEDPQESSKTIDPRKILRQEQLTDEEIEAVEQELHAFQSIKVALKAS